MLVWGVRLCVWAPTFALPDPRSNAALQSRSHWNPHSCCQSSYSLAGVLPRPGVRPYCTTLSTACPAVQAQVQRICEAVGCLFAR